MNGAERLAAELGLQPAEIDDGTPDPWAINIAMSIACLGVTFGAVLADWVAFGVVMCLFAVAFAALGIVLRDG